ncbi:hypothetical protein, partial [Roseinatronobacter sp. NSM]|uniref:hypothetical protein n=1 Tax=Roseinatronobacter sp. NSM TaxID=3457785 RepID=UPI004035BB19
MQKPADPQIPLRLAAAMADFLTQNAAFRAGFSDGYRKAVRDHIWRVNCMSVMHGIQKLMGSDVDTDALSAQLRKLCSKQVRALLTEQGSRSKRSAIYAKIHRRLTGSPRDYTTIQNACRDLIEELPDPAALDACGLFGRALFAFSDWSRIAPLFAIHPTLQHTAGLHLSLVLNDKDTHDILAPAVALSRAMMQQPANDPASQIIAATAGLKSHIRSISPDALRPPMEAAISEHIPKGGPEICDRLLSG